MIVVKTPHRLLLLVLWGVLCAGCGYSSQRLSLDQPGAHQALEKALKAWQDGRKPADLKPDVVVGDEDWDAGLKLSSFKVLSGETNDGTNLHIPVELSLKDAEGADKTSNVTYTVGTSPVVTVIRE